MEDQLNPPPHINLFNDNNPAAPTESFSPHYHESFMIQPTTLNPDHNQGLRLPFMLQGETTVRETQHSNLGFFDLTATAHHPFNSSSSLYSLIHPFFGVGSSNGTLNNLPSFHQESHSLVLPSNNSINCYPQAFNGGPLYDEKWHHPTPPPNQLHMINHSEFTSWKDHDHLTTTGQDLNSNPTWMQQDGRYDDQSTYNHNHTNNQQLSLSLSSHNHPSILSGLCLQQDNSPCSADNHQLPSHSGSATTGDVSLSSSSNGNLNSSSSSFSQILVSKSKYLGVIQEILSDFATFSLENMEDVAFTTTGGTDKSSMHHSQQQEVMRIPPPFKGFDQEFSLSLEGGGHVSDANVGGPSSIQKKKNKAKKAELLALLQMVDDCYNQSLDEIHTVISAFHAATELDPQIHACSALQTISVCYKSLKEKISNQILKMGPNIDCGGGSSSRHQPREGEVEGDQGEVSFEKSFLQKQWALQQLRRRDQLWRPQRGLPERSVSVLRAWMFQNFLHPYPKDSEKHLLAIKSGLTRSQVSNWFINARVRLWKPLIEEMYSELNRRKARQSHDGSNPTAAAATGALSNRILNMN